MLNILHKDGTAAHPRDRLMRAIQGSRPGLPMQPTLNADPESGPIVGDPFATLVWYAGKSSLGLFYLRTQAEVQCGPYEQADRVIALTQEQLLTPPTVPQHFGLTRTPTSLSLIRTMRHFLLRLGVQHQH